MERYAKDWQGLNRREQVYSVLSWKIVSIFYQQAPTNDTAMKYYSILNLVSTQLVSQQYLSLASVYLDPGCLLLVDLEWSGIGRETLEYRNH